MNDEHGMCQFFLSNITGQTQHLQKMNVWAGNFGDQVIRPDDMDPALKNFIENSIKIQKFKFKKKSMRKIA